MALNPKLESNNVRVGVSGAIAYAPVGTTLPTSTATALNAAFKELGYLSEDGLEENYDVKREQIRGWQNADVVREATTEAKVSFKGTLIETTSTTVSAFYGTTITQTATEGSYTIDAGASSGVVAVVIAVIDGSQVKYICVEKAEIFKDDGVKYANGEAIGYPVEIVCYSKPKVYDTALKTGI